MCGIAGIFSFSQSVDLSTIRVMTDTIRHRGPDGEGAWLSKEERVGLGHRRLSIIDVSELGAQPMHYLDRYTITFNGEIYNYKELRADLEKAGYKFRSHGDTEVLLALYDQKKEKALDLLDGMFAFAIWDQREKTLFCARDRFGEKPFFYHHTSAHFIFASEIKAILSTGVPRKTNDRKIYNYFLYTVFEDQYHKNETFFENIVQLEAAHYLVIHSNGQIHSKRYWDIDLNQKIDLKKDEYTERFMELFTRSIKRRLRSDVPVGSSLSGGLDSSSIVMMIDRLKNQGIQKTFSARFPGFERDEGSFMERVISKTNVEPHFIFPSSDSSFSHLKKISYHQEAPMGTLSVAVQYEVMKLAKTNGVTVLLDGQGADETLAGYTPYWEVYFSELYRTNKTLLRSEEDAYIQLHKEKPFVRNAEFLWKAYGIDSFNKTSNLKRRFTNVHSPYFLGIHPDIVRRYRVDPNPLQKFNTLKGSLYFATMVRGLNELLSYADRNSMAHSVEVRLPFLYHELVEFIFATPNEMLLHNGWTKYLLRRSMDDILPKEIAWRTDKIGYEPPQDKWLQSKDYKDQIQASIEYLKKKNIITTECQRLTWRYLSLYAFLSAFDDS